jgi:hypothetical protein
MDGTGCISGDSAAGQSALLLRGSDPSFLHPPARSCASVETGGGTGGLELTPGGALRSINPLANAINIPTSGSARVRVRAVCHCRRA